ncbi:MAG: TonB-dependent receptor [Bacteroidota bacterium]
MYLMSLQIWKSLRRHGLKSLFALLVAASPLLGMAQVKAISGTITDENGKPLQGVSVTIIKGGKAGTTTDMNGKFSIKAPLKSILLVSSLNFEPRELVVDAKEVYNLSLKASNANSLDDVVIVGYGAVKRKDLTGSVGSVNMKDAAKAPVKSFDDFLAGRVSGVIVQSSDGQPGANANIVIRGAGSISQDNSPLYVVDGFPTESSNANAISPADIESIDILKDASATAIYGARGSNGVILITTKKGKNGPPQVTYNFYAGWQTTPQKMEMMNPYEFVRYVKEVRPALADSVYLKSPITLNDYLGTPSFDMQDLVFQTGRNENHDISLRGGNENTRYSLSGNFNNQRGIIVGSGFKRYQGRISLDQTVTSKLKAGVNANYSYTELIGQPISATNFYASSTPLYSVWGWRPVSSAKGYDSATNLETAFYDPVNDLSNSQDYRVNPYINLVNQYTKNKTSTFVANVYAEYAFSKNLKLRISGGITSVNVTNETFNNSLTQSGSKWNTSGVNGSIATAPVTTWLNENTLTYTKAFGKNHHLAVVAGVSEQGNKNAYRYFYAAQLPNEDLGLDGLDLATVGNTSTVSNSSRWTLVSGLGRINYDFQSKYFLTASMRGDGSSKFAKGHKWGYFPSGAFSWKISSEKFMRKITAVSEAKLRVSYGQSGNNRVSDFAYLPTVDFNNINYYYSSNRQFPAIAGILGSAGNYGLKWETNTQANIGIDLGFFKQRITLTADIYKRTTNDLLLNADLPYANGVASASGFKNVGSLENNGLEFSLNSINIQQKDITWTSSFNISFNRNKILSLAEGQLALLRGSGTFFNTTYSALSPYISVIGRPVGEMYGLVFDGVYQYTDFDKMPNGTYLLKSNIPTNGVTRTAQLPGDIKYKDLNGDGMVDTKDYTIIGSGLPVYTGGLTNNFRYKNFDLNVLLQWSVGNDVINANRYIFEGGVVVNSNLNQFASYANRWSPTNPSNTMFRGGGMGNAAYSSRVIEDGSYLKLRTVSLGYNLPASVLRKVKISNLRVYASAQNLYTWTNYSGQDPEASSRQSNLTPGFDYTTYPHSLSVVAGVNVTF